PKLPINIFSIGYGFDSLGRRGDAIPLYERARTLAEKMLPPDSRASLLLLGHLPYAYLVRGRYADSERAVRHDMAVLGRWVRSQPQEAGRHGDLRSLARVYGQQGYYADAAWFYTRAYVLERKPGELPSAAAMARHATHVLGPMHFLQGRYADAEAIYAQELSRLEKALAYEQ